VLLVASLVALVVAGAYAAVPVRNPGVQDCGAPGAYLLTNRQDVVVAVGTPDSPPDASRLRTQPPCRALVNTALERAGLFVVAGVGIGLAGAFLGLADDRARFRRAPRFEDLVRPRPADAPGRVLDPVPVAVSSLGARLPPLERVEVAVVLGGGLAGVVGLVAMAGIRPLRDVLGGVGVTPVLALAAIVAVGRLAAGSTRWVALGPWAAEEDTALQPVEGSAGTADPEDLAEVALAADGVARLRPELGVAGLDLHHLARWGVGADEARTRVATSVLAALAVHVVALVGVWLVARPSAVEPDGRTYVVALAVLALVVVAGLARVRRVVGAATVVPRRADLVVAVRPDRRVRTGAAALGAVAQILVEVVALWVAVEAVGGTLGVGTLALAWLLAVTVGALSPAGSGAGLVEGVLAVLLWRWGTSAAEAVAAVLLLRVATWWLPIVPGLVATRRLRAEGRL
jgi:hypothetical protein